MRYITDRNLKDWVARFAELNLEVEWGLVHPSLKANDITFTFHSLNAHPEAAEALWNGDVELAFQIVTSVT